MPPAPDDARGARGVEAYAPAGPVRVVYTDIDGTLTREGSLLHGAHGPSLAAARGLVALHEAGVAVVPVSGRTAGQLEEFARLIGADAFICEMGSAVHPVGGGAATPAYTPRGAAGGGRPAEHLRALGVPELLADAYPGRLEPHEPWYSMREYTLPFRGHVDAAEANARLRKAHAGLKFVDNGVVEPVGALDVDELHVYHALYEEVGKGRGIAADLERRGLGPEHAVAIGDSPADLKMAEAVGAFFLVDARWRAHAREMENVFVADRPYGEGFRHVVDAVLGEG